MSESHDFDLIVIGAGSGGVRLTPVSGLRISFDAEIGRADRPLTPISDRKFHNESARVQWRKKSLLLSGYFKNKLRYYRGFD